MIPLIITSVLLNCMAQLYMKKGMMGGGEVSAQGFISAIPSMITSGHILSAVVGYYFFGEAVTPIRISGITVICIRIVLISRS